MEVSKFWKIVEFLKISIKIKNCKTFYKSKTLDKILLRLWNRIFLTGIYRNIQKFAFKVLQECSFWASRNGAVQMFFLPSIRNMFAGIFVKSERFIVVLREHIIFNVKWVEVRKMNEVFWAKLYCKMNDLFRYLIFKKNFDDIHWNMWTNMKMLYAWNNIFKKRIPNIRFWIIYILDQISFYGGLL